MLKTHVYVALTKEFNDFLNLAEMIKQNKYIKILQIKGLAQL